MFMGSKIKRGKIRCNIYRNLLQIKFHNDDYNITIKSIRDGY